VKLLYTLVFICFSIPAMAQTTQTTGSGTITSNAFFISSPAAPKDLPPCAFNLSRVEVLAKVKPTPNLNVFQDGSIPNDLIYFRPPTRWSCPYERAIELYGEERVLYIPPTGDKLCLEGDCKYVPAHVSVCDENNQNCTVVYTEGK